jgi:hypothetical protein
MPNPSDSPPGKNELVLMRRRETRPRVPRMANWRDHRAWLSSCLLHTLILVSAALLWQPRTRGTGGQQPDRPVGIAVAHQANGREEFYLTGGGAKSAAAASKEAADAAMAQAAVASEEAGPPVSLSELMDGLVGKADSGGSDGAAGDGLAGLGTGTNGTGSGQGKSTTTFMGLRGTGSSFVYVLDRSGSMLEFDGAPMRTAKRELLNSIQSLSPKNQFQVVFYNESPGALNPGTAGGKMLQANDINKDKAIRFVQAIAPQGGTEHIPGLKMGLSFSSDVLFFLTDAAEPAMNESQLLEIQSRAERSLTTIHTIQFNRGPETNDGGWIRALAEMNRGTYRYVDILSLE